MEICGECKWYTFEEIDRGYVCTNADSPYCAEWVGHEHRCDEYEEKRGQNNEQVL